MPVTAEVRSPVGNHHQVAFADFDEAVTSGAQVPLARGVRLDRCDDLYAATAHSTRAAAIRMVTATIAMSTAVFCC